MSGMQPGPLDWNERFSDDVEAAETHHDARQAQIHTSMPGIIVSYNAATMTAVVQPALQAFHTQIDGTRVPTTITTISDVPVHFPGGGGHLMTFPVKAGDECWLVFAERSIDNWFAHGGVAQPSDWRMHDLNDPVCHVGVRSQPKVPQNVNPSAVELRSDDGMTLVQISGPNQSINVTARNVTLGASSGNLGVLGTTPIAKGNITGSKSGNVALANLLHFLAQRGDLTDNTT